MADVVLFHHVQGLTDGIRSLASGLAASGHTVHTPDLFDGERPGTIEAGVAFARGLSDDLVAERVEAVLADLPAELVYAGVSWGVMTAQRLAQTRAGARGALFYESCLPITGEWSFGPWPAGVPVQIHGMENDPFFSEEGGDLDFARELVATVGDGAELFTYPGDAHLFTDSSLPSYDEQATMLVLERSRQLLDRLG